MSNNRSDAEGEVIPNYLDYNHYYVLLTSDFNNWQETSGRPEDLAAVSWVTADAVDWGNESLAIWSYGSDDYGKFTKVPTQGDNLLVPWDPSQDAELTLVAASDTAYYFEQGFYMAGDYVWEGDFHVSITLNNDNGPISLTPEPTSGLLLLFGLAGLALRRRS